MKLLQIVEGYVNKAISGTPLASRELELLSRVRMRVCMKCKVNNKPCLNAFNSCCQCGCNMEAKTRAIHAKCPLGKW